MADEDRDAGVEKKSFRARDGRALTPLQAAQEAIERAELASRSHGRAQDLELVGVEWMRAMTYTAYLLCHDLRKQKHG